MRSRTWTAGMLVVAAAIVVSNCGGGGGEPAPEPAAAPEAAPAADTGGLTAVELEQGIGPIRDLVLDPVDADLAATGEEAFQLKCSACHKLEIRYVAPALGDVLSRRRPEYVMNMMLNPTEMIARHPEVQKLMGEFLTPMADQQLTEAEARAILEYLRSAQVPVN